MPPPVRRPEPVVIARSEPLPAPIPHAAAPIVSDPAPTTAPTPGIVPVQNVSLPAPAPQPEVRVPHVVTLTAGTLLAIRVGETISSDHNQPGDSFLATLTRPLVIDGFIIADRGARVEGRVVESTASGRMRSTSHLSIALVRLATDDRQNIRIQTDPYIKDETNSNAVDAAKVGGGAAIGAIIGALAGGGKGAAIGAGAGGVLGAGDVLLTRGKAAQIPVETRITFRVQDSITITERLD
jgi:hypothetical protein